MQEEGDSETKPCELCCKLPGPDSPCRSSFEWTKAPHDVPDMYSKAGTPCNNYQGYCDVFKKCREVIPITVRILFDYFLVKVDPLGPLLTLHDILFSDNSLKNLRSFITKYWYSVILAAIAVIALMVRISCKVFLSITILFVKVTIIKLCGKKTPLVHHRRHRRRKVHHHVNNPTGGLDGPDEVHIHPTTVTDDLTRQRRKRKESSKKVSVSDKRAEENKRNYDSAQALADKLSSKISSASTSADKAKDNKRQHPAENTRKAKTHTGRSEALPDLIEVLEDKETTKKHAKDRSEQQQPKEVTIAKLGPFKMSLEVKKNDEAAKSKEKDHPSRKKKMSNTNNPQAIEKTSQAQRRRKRSRSKSEHRKKESTAEPVSITVDEEDHLYQEIEQITEPSKEVKVESKKIKKSKDKIVVSKLVKSDRPLREKSPEKSIKYGRSISQPAPPPNIHLLLPSESHHNLSRNLSLRATEKEKQSKLRRSSTAIANVEEKSPSRSRQVEKMSLYDNQGFDLSPSLERKVMSEKKQQKYLNLKDQIHNQLKMAAAAASSEAGTTERRRDSRGRQRYFPINETDGFNDSDCSDDINPQSPPTQVQSLSEESSGSTRRKSSQLSQSSDESEPPLSSLGLVHNSRQYGVEGSDSETDPDCKVPVSASNPHVRVPNLSLPVPLPRTSLQHDKLKDDPDGGCESDATLDILDYSGEEAEDWQVAEGSDTDGIAQQMMY